MAVWDELLFNETETKQAPDYEGPAALAGRAVPRQRRLFRTHESCGTTGLERDGYLLGRDAKRIVERAAKLTR
jgi:hypothetical protein